MSDSTSTSTASAHAATAGPLPKDAKYPSSVVVFGATGNQGNSVARALLAADVKVVAVSRNPESDKAKELAAAGATVIQADLNDPASYADALKGAEGVFLNLDYWQFYNGSNAEEAQALEYAQGKKAIDAIHAAGIKHLVFSTLESHEAPYLPIPHTDAKVELTAYIKKLGIPTTFLCTSYYFSNVFVQTLTPTAEGALVLGMAMPNDTPIPSFAVEQTGLWVRAAFANPDEWIGKDMEAAAETLTVAEYAQVLSEVLGHNVVTENRTPYQFWTDVETDREWWMHQVAMVTNQVIRDVEASRKVVPQAWTFKEWVKHTPAIKDKFAKAKHAQAAKAAARKASLELEGSKAGAVEQEAAMKQA